MNFREIILRREGVEEVVRGLIICCCIADTIPTSICVSRAEDHDSAFSM